MTDFNPLVADLKILLRRFPQQEPESWAKHQPLAGLWGPPQASRREVNRVRRNYPPVAMRLGGSELIVIVVFLIPTVWALFDALQTTTDVWTAAKQNQAVWVLVVLLLPVIGALLFFLIARPRLNEVR